VEHPVTEAITGLDLVEWQLRVAAGERLPKTQSELHANGHAVEARLYAEDPQRDFLPSIGRLQRLRLPQPESGLRVDTGVREGDEVTMFYDPMIAKVIAWDHSREGAIAKLADGLAQTEVAGVRTNAAFLVRLLRRPEFIAGTIDTGFIDRHRDALLAPQTVTAQLYARAALFVVEERAQHQRGHDPWDARDGFRLSGEARETVDFVGDFAGDFVGESGRVPVEITHLRSGEIALRVLGEEISPAAHRHAKAMRLASGEIAVMEGGETWLFSVSDPFAQADTASGRSDRIVSPMPGKIVKVLVEPKAQVKRSQPLVVLEAMKMEHTLLAPADSVVEAIDVAVGDQVQEGMVVVRFADKPAAPK
jgi:3-methylcrotonyl-CoA carboxylase alpha subunit